VIGAGVSDAIGIGTIKDRQTDPGDPPPPPPPCPLILQFGDDGVPFVDCTETHN
jgi:hypothetical protein